MLPQILTLAGPLSCRERAEKIADLEGKLRDESEIMETRQTELEQLEVRKP